MNTQDAVNEMLDIAIGLATLNGWEFVTEDRPPKANPLSLQPPYLRAIVRHATGRQSSLSGASGQRMYDATGTLWIEIYAKTGTGNTQGYSMSDMVMDAYRVKRPNASVWYRNIRMHEGPAEGASKKNQVLIDFVYSMLR